MNRWTTAWIAALLAMGFEARAADDDGIDQRIRQYRTAQATLTLTDSQGRPLAHTPVRIEMRRHKFLFGSNVFPLNRCGSDELNERYARQFADLFNFATLPFYWGSYERTEGKTREDELREMAEWCRARGIRPKGHPLCWCIAQPAWLESKPVDEVERLQVARIQREVSAFKGLIDTWDVANEVVMMPEHNEGKEAVSRLCKKLGRVALLEKCFAEAVRSNPQATLLLNDWCTDQPYVDLNADSLAAGVRIDAIGIQTHMHSAYLGPKKLWDICERFAALKRPLHFTELTILSTKEKREGDWFLVHTDWASTPEGEDVQAKQAVETYRLLFSHPAVEAITWWDFSDLQAFRGAPGGLVRKDMTPKPAYNALLQLIKKDWWTPAQDLKTDANGSVEFRGYLGDYILKTAGGEKAFLLDKPGSEAVAVSLPGP